jgi:uncharacterized membrane protein SpoIIM required for sporulation
MVLEFLISPEKAENKPSLMIILGFFYTSLALLLGNYIFEDYSSLFSVFLATMVSIPIVYKLMKMEEQKDLQDVSEKFLLKEHSKAISAFILLFIGATLCFAFWYVVLSSNTIGTLFEAQIETLNAMNPGNGVTGQITGEMAGMRDFNRIFFNNVKVLLFCVLFSFLYGAGSLFILIWNASIIGIAIGNYIRTKIATIAMSLGGVSIGQYFSVVSIGLFRYVIHGVPEILAYFVGALAGAIISIAVVNHEINSRKFEHILLDSADLLMVSLFILFIAALLEVFVTPIIFPPAVLG